MHRVIHFEIPADDPARATKFYGEVFGWKIDKFEGPQEYWLVTTGPKDQPGIDGGILPRPHPGAPVVNTIDVPSLDEAIRKVEEKGGKLVVPKMTIPGVGELAYCQDPEGNTFGIIQEEAR
jgi:predicted enzyme related to lactoylglutathione lyase